MQDQKYLSDAVRKFYLRRITLQLFINPKQFKK